MPRSNRSGSSGASGKHLGEEQKKANHIASEKKRREAIRVGFDKLASLVPGLEGQGRSEALVLAGTLQTLREQILLKDRLMEEARAQGHDVSAFTIDPTSLKAAKDQTEREQGNEKADEKAKEKAKMQAQARETFALAFNNVQAVLGKSKARAKSESKTSPSLRKWEGKEGEKGEEGKDGRAIVDCNPS